MSLHHAIFILIASFLAWLFWRQLAHREKALSLAIALCEKSDVQLLDQSTGLHRIRLRSRGGLGLYLESEYHFEFSSTGDRRYTGRIFMVGERVVRTDMDAFRDTSMRSD